MPRLQFSQLTASVIWSPFAESIVITAGSEGTLAAWDLQHHRQLASQTFAEQGGLTQIIPCPGSIQPLSLSLIFRTK